MSTVNPLRRRRSAWIESAGPKIESRLTGNTIYLANRLEKFTGLETRITILGTCCAAARLLPRTGCWRPIWAQPASS
jgi:hypothetical protein